MALSWLTKSNLFPRPQYCIRCSCCALFSQLSYTKTRPTRLLAEDIERWILDRHSRANPFVELPVCQLAPTCCRKFCKLKGIVINKRSERKSRISKAPRVEMCRVNSHTKYIKLSFRVRRFLWKSSHGPTPIVLYFDRKCIVSELMDRKKWGRAASVHQSCPSASTVPQGTQTFPSDVLQCVNRDVPNKQKEIFSVRERKKAARIGRAVRRKWQWFMSVNWSVNLRLFFWVPKILLPVSRSLHDVKERRDDERFLFFWWAALMLSD